MKIEQLTYMIGVTILAVVRFPSIAVACADGYSCAVVKNTADGFVALRAAQSADSELLSRLRPYEIIVIVSSDCDTGSKWTQVASVPRIDGDWDNSSRVRSTGGWVRSSLLAFSNCPQGLTQ